MPDDLLRFVSGPTPYSAWWLWLGAALLLIVIGWYVGVFVWTMPSSRLRHLRGIRSVHARMLRRRFARTVGSVGARYRSGELSASEAGAQMSRTLRSFLHQATGTPAQYMHVDDIESSELAAAAPTFSALNDAQFNTVSPVDVSEIASATEELILSWP
ncbi:hypothetical protein [Mycobacterium deserti]|uniref:DUF4381 domain-containing protein n=1 Tax=Mycobacterium deserti TaxID=2978347 RepID=A0ABT2MBH3_9MYCO|nr:hypothetical protein [Mycobacterium deserti]MCT7658500.1 hypothetical protein [Mycobacterium deserti]